MRWFLYAIAKTEALGFFCFIGGFRPTQEFFTHMETSPLPVKGCKLWPTMYAQHSWLLSSKGSLACHIFCDTGLPFKMVISEDPWDSHLLPSLWQWSCHCLFLRLRSDATGDRTPISRMRGEHSTSMPPRGNTIKTLIDLFLLVLTDWF